MLAYTGTSVSHGQLRKKSGGVLGKNADEWTGRVEISKEKISGSKRSMYGYILTYSRLMKNYTHKQVPLSILTQTHFDGDSVERMSLSLVGHKNYTFIFINYCAF